MCQLISAVPVGIMSDAADETKADPPQALISQHPVRSSSMYKYSTLRTTSTSESNKLADWRLNQISGFKVCQYGNLRDIPNFEPLRR